jgi:hypothetical protein
MAAAPVGQGVSAISAVIGSSGQIGSITTIGRTTSLMLDAAIKTVEVSTRPMISGSGTLSELMNRTPAMRSDAPARLREGDGASPVAPAPTVPSSSAPAAPASSAPASSQPAAAPAATGTQTPGTPASAPPAGTPAAPPPSDSGATGAPASPGAPAAADPARPAESGREAPAGAGQGADGNAPPQTPSEGPRSWLPDSLERAAVPTTLWARLARWLGPDASRDAPPPADVVATQPGPAQPSGDATLESASAQPASLAAAAEPSPQNQELPNG